MTDCNTAPLLSIAIPTLNRSSMIAKALSSALSQSSEKIEILVSDNGSSDDTQSVLAKFDDPRLRKYRRETTIPVSEHGNFLIDEARGMYFLGLSDDDWLEPDFVTRVLAFLERSPNVAFLYTGCMIHYGNTRVPALTGPSLEPGHRFISAFFAGEREVCWCACVTRTEDLRKIGPIPDGTIFGDMYYWTKLSFLGPVGCVPDVLSNYRFMTDNNLSTGVPVREWALETRNLVNEVIAEYEALVGRGEELQSLQRSCRLFIARSTANQFVWNRLRGADRWALVRELGAISRLLLGDSRMIVRVACALAMPSPMLRTLVLAAAGRRSKLRSARLKAH